MSPEDYAILNDKLALRVYAARIRATLTPRELEVLDQRFGLDDEVTGDQIKAEESRGLDDHSRVITPTLPPSAGGRRCDSL